MSNASAPYGAANVNSSTDGKDAKDVARHEFADESPMAERSNVQLPFWRRCFPSLVIGGEYVLWISTDGRATHSFRFAVHVNKAHVMLSFDSHRPSGLQRWVYMVFSENL
jgi:hypothetical protein